METFDEDLRRLIDDLGETMYGEHGIGLAATQVNAHQRVLVLDVSETRDDLRVYINPEVLREQGVEVSEEGCLSVPGVYAEVQRAERIDIRARAPDGTVFEESLDGLHAVCLQHEMDHLNGKLFVDYLSPLKRQLVRKRLEKQRRQADKKTAVLL